MSRTILGAAVCLGVAALAIGLSPTAETQEKDKKITLRSPRLYYLDRADVSPRLRDMKIIPPRRSFEREEHAVKLLHPPRPISQANDPIVQRGTGRAPNAPLGGPLASTSAGLNFDGNGVGLAGFSVTGAPPDTNGAPGATQYVQWVNTAFTIFNKSTGAVVMGPADGNTLWQGFGGACEANNDGDPIASYDKQSGRWVLTQFVVTGGPPFWQCIAVSTTSDATGSYRRFAYQFPNFDDYPKLSVWSDAYYITFNMFNAAGTSFLGSDLCALDRNQMITASGTPGPIQCFQLSSSFGGVLPGDLDGSTAPPAGSPNFMFAFGTNVLQMWKFKVNWTTPSSSTVTGPTNISVASFSEACGGGTCIPQPSTTQKLDSLADRMMYRNAYRNFGDHESIVLAHSVTNGTTASGVRWYEIRNPNGTPTVFQQSTFSPDATSRWMPSIAMDQSGNIALGYSASSTSVRPSVRFTGRLATDALNTMQAENTIITGAGSQTGSLSRWGDYSAMTIDPSDDCTFWYTNEYLKTTGSFNWSTRIASFKFPSCGGTATPDFTVTAAPTSVAVNQGGTGTSTITVGSLSGFASAVSLSASGLPAGVTASFAPTSVTPPSGGTGASTLTFTAASSATTGTFNVTVTGASGSTSHTATISLSVNPVATADYSVSLSPATVSVAQSGSGTSTVTVTSTGGFNSAVGLAASGLPAGVTASFSPASVTPPGNGTVTSTLTLTASSTATTGTATVTVTGTSGANTRTATLSLTVTPAGGTELLVNGGFEGGTASPWTLATNYNFQNAAGSFPHTGTGYILNNPINNENTTAFQTVTIPSTATGTLTLWLNVTTQETTTTTQFDKLMVEVRNTSGTVLGTLGTFSNLDKAANNTAGLYTQKTLNASAFKGQTVRLTFHVTSDGSLTTTFRLDDISLK